MWFTSWLRTWKRSAPRADAHGFPRQRPTFRPQLEALENRIVPSFSSPLSIPVPQPQGMVAADLTGNGKTDLVVGVGYGVDGVWVLMGGAEGRHLQGSRLLRHQLR